MAGIGNRIKKAREATGMSQAEMGRRLGVTRSGVSQWENERTAPTTRNISAIAVLLDVSWEWLTTGREGVEDAPGARGGYREGLRLNADERELIERYRRANPERRRLSVEMLKAK
jgi:transcriptional regulator with XRE-family HTH domain